MPHPRQTGSQEILAAALQMLEESGHAALSLRGLATRVGVQAPSLYRYFPDKSSLEQAMAASCSSLLHAALSRALGNREEGRVERLAAAYLRFARTRTALYRFMMDGPAAMDTSAEGAALWQLVVATVSGHTGKRDDTAGAVALWSYLHGYASLELSGRFGASGPRGGFQRGLQAILRPLS